MDAQADFVATDPSLAPQPPPEPTDGVRVLRLAMRLAVGLLGSGAQTDDVESAIAAVTAAYAVDPVQAAVTFSMISVSWDPLDEPPTTLFHFVRERTVDFDRLASTSGLVRRIRRAEISLEHAELELDDIERGRPAYGAVARFLAPAVSAAGSTVMFGGNLLESAATLGIALLVQPALAVLDRSDLPPFFRVAFGATASTLLVALLVGLDAPVSGGLILTGSLLRFLPGYALVSGFRDLVAESVLSGAARLAEALLLGAAVAGGTALALRIAETAGVPLSIVTTGHSEWAVPATAVAAVLAVGGYAVQVGVPRGAVATAATLGGAGWLLLDRASAGNPNPDAAIATLAAATLIGAVGRFLARRQATPAALFVVPAILPLLPGLTLVQAMLAVTDAARVSGLIDATVTAFVVGAGVASGDIVVDTARRIRERYVAPAVGAVAGGVDVLVIGPVERVSRVLGGGRHGSLGARSPEDPGHEGTTDSP